MCTSAAILLTALAAATPLAAVAQGTPPAPPVLLDATLLDVTAEGRALRTPDIATIRAGVVTQATTAAAALADNARRMAAVNAALRRAGIAARDLQTASIQLQPQYRYGENQPPVITGYQASNQLGVRFRDVSRAGAILDALVAQGANQIEGPNLSVDAVDAAEDEARTDAIRRARARADLYARAAGLKVERVLSIVEGNAPPAPPMPMVRQMSADAAASETQVSAGEQAITANVTVRFLLR